MHGQRAGSGSTETLWGAAALVAPHLLRDMAHKRFCRAEDPTRRDVTGALCERAGPLQAGQPQGQRPRAGR